MCSGRPDGTQDRRTAADQAGYGDRCAAGRPGGTDAQRRVMRDRGRAERKGGMEHSKARNRMIGTVLGICGLIAVALSVGILFSRSADESFYIIYITKTRTSSNDFWAAIRKGADTAARENSVTLEVMMPHDEMQIEEQNGMIREAVAKRPNAIVVTPSSETETLEALQEVRNAGIPLVFIDSMTEEAIADAVVATDNMEAGKKVAEAMRQTLTREDRIAIVNHVQGSSTAREREAGLREGLAGYAGQIVATVYSNSSADTGAEVTKQLLREHPEITYLACMNEDSTVGAARAVKELGLEEQITMVGFDNAMETIQDLEAGVFSAIVVQKAFTMGYFGIENAVRLVRGEAVPYYTDSGSVLVTKETMYTEENEELLFPFYGQE
ncbi:MAG: substrate-binding domain-containing protein [Eubacteriales bacterium]|nr:substrate-binding domain-containing protein [Eubacteriales bacterium]